MGNVNLESHITKKQELPLIFHDHCAFSGCSCTPNLHENIEILYFYEGEGKVHLDFRERPVKSGDIVVVNSNVIHYIESDHYVRYYCLIVYRDYAQQFGIDTNRLNFHEYIRGEHFGTFFRQLNHEYFTGGKYREAIVKLLSMEILTEICKKYATEKEDIPLTGVLYAVGYIKANYKNPITAEQIASKSGYSLSYLSHIFHEKTGYSIIDYVNMTRCEFAKTQLLTTDHSISVIAMDCGFRNDSYFTRTFRKMTGVPPSAYRKNMKK